MQRRMLHQNGGRLNLSSAPETPRGRPQQRPRQRPPEGSGRPAQRRRYNSPSPRRYNGSPTGSDDPNARAQSPEYAPTTPVTNSSNDGSANDSLPEADALKRLAEELDKRAHEEGTLTCEDTGLVAKLQAKPELFQGVVNPDSNLYVDTPKAQASLVIEALQMSKPRSDFIGNVTPVVWRILNNRELYHVVNRICDPDERGLMLRQIRDYGDPMWASALICEIYDCLSYNVCLSSITGNLSRATWDVLKPYDVTNLIIKNCVHDQEDGFKVIDQAIDNGCLCPEEDDADICCIVQAIATKIETVPEDKWKYMSQSKVKQALTELTDRDDNGDDDGDDERSFQPWKHLRPKSMKELIEETLSSITKKRLLARAVDGGVFNRFTTEDTSDLIRFLIDTDFLTAEDLPDELLRKGDVERILTEPENMESKQTAVNTFMRAHALGCVDASFKWVEHFIRHVITKSDDGTDELFEPAVHPSRFGIDILELHRGLLFDIWRTHHVDNLVSEPTQGDDLLDIENVFYTWKTPDKHMFNDWMQNRVTTRQIAQYLIDQAEEIVKTFRLMQQIETSLSPEGIVKVTEKHVAIKDFAQDILSIKVNACNADEDSIWNQ